ncbi:tripartite tricarboxylate transporter permease [Fusibacter paucivorans]|uniref:Tripartite tricarboxylate transporter permease n=1 Tax=Fusibacter paucivorans TaxID=76009 RepID=A0ABS5PJG9_9FIRM|nr:tripartite tricarboxylate transporter permease [Fusibacter paucivorans]MBS7525270.1 tripartite tricarboxylate transporter permease [Fusibacter paucivorans]
MFLLLLQGFGDIVLNIHNLIFLIGGVALGLIMGAIPGLTSTMAIALIIPLTFYITPVQSLVMLLGAYNGGIFGGSLSAILLATPGTPASAATAADGFKLALQGKAGKAIKMAITSSIFGCLFSSIVLIIIAEPIARYALKFGPGEYTVLMIFSLTIIASAAGKSVIKGLIGGILGLLFGMVGLDPIYSVPRFTFGIPYLGSGLSLVVMLIGSLAVSEIFRQIESVSMGRVSAHLPPPTCREDDRLSFSEMKQSFKSMMRSALIGCGIGSLPGLGPTLAAYIGYDMAKRNSKNPDLFGEGSLEGIAAAETANNAVCGANLIPLLALGVPGDTVAAILIGAFMIQGLTPGPLIFREAPELVYSIYAGLILSNIVLFIIVMLTHKGFSRIARLETTIIYPVVLMFCIVGVYALNQSIFDIWIMMMFAIIGYIMVKFDFSPATMMIGFILSPIFELNLRQALLISNNQLSIFFSTPITWVFWLITLYSVYNILNRKRKERQREKQQAIL